MNCYSMNGDKYEIDRSKKRKVLSNPSFASRSYKSEAIAEHGIV